jgi:ADP-ribose pyrophosphatase YjhB (NUDIX family)
MDNFPVHSATRDGRRRAELQPQVREVLLACGYNFVGFGRQLLTEGSVFRLAMTARALLAPVAFGVAGAIYDVSGNILLVRQTYMRGWRLPGGGVGRGESPSLAVRRELAEEVGLAGGTAELFGLYSRKAGWATNVIALFRITGAEIAFQPNWEVSAVCFADPLAPPEGTTPATVRRLQELAGRLPKAEQWNDA